MKNFSWKKYLMFLSLAIVILGAIILNIIYIPKYYDQLHKNNSVTYKNVEIRATDKNGVEYLNKTLIFNNVTTLADVIEKDTKDFDYSVTPGIGIFVIRIGNIKTDINKEYFDLRSGDSDDKDAQNINPICKGENNSCEKGATDVILEDINVFRFVLTAVKTNG
ncbi:hypothetical protein SSYRP_v1c07340 [Spiroplasma syrphidicola EA-1]|uniref:Uncharacterized protein n=1 Tax=Spiroplasma syrphidicola EA-1 TaxID=1276229 RepID=R4UEG7_9MOLU|nr:hypothetical protein [Spiroplasma syrphidicola]AGM26324.1 hypothetical protein SSYRP_v1c07340 [Spiroplasma syrphidicola EA-1]